MMLCIKTAMQKMTLKDQAFIEKVCVKKSSNLIGQENFWATGFSLCGVENYIPISEKMTRSPVRSPIIPLPPPHTHKHTCAH